MFVIDGYYHVSKDKDNRMLVLTRKKFQAICIGDDIVISIVKICGGQVQVGIEAPAHVKIHRQEVYAAIQREAAKAGQEEREPKEQA